MDLLKPEQSGRDTGEETEVEMGRSSPKRHSPKGCTGAGGDGCIERKAEVKAGNQLRKHEGSDGQPRHMSRGTRC
jgi:hypothetical protein